MVKKVMFPQPDFERSEWLNLNGTWDFSFDKPEYDSKIEVPYPWGSPLSGITESKDGTGYYRRTACWNPNGERIFLVFGAVDYIGEVAVNGEKVGSHRGGYDRFEFDVTDLWKRDGENIIEVAATDLAKNNQTYGKQGYGNARGIWQTVWLEARPKAYISSFFVKTAMNGVVTYEVSFSEEVRGVLAADFAGVVHAELPVNGCSATLSFTVENPLLWSPEEPNLYEGRLSLTAENAVDTVSTYFGIRELSTAVLGEHQHRYITINGKPYFMNGVLDQSFNPKGYFTLPSDEDCRMEIQRLKNIGVNMARIHIKAEEPLKLYYADKLGLLIMEDIPCFWGNPEPDTMAQFEREMEAEICRDRNHPSVFYWVVFNETWGLFTKWTDTDGNAKREYRPETVEWVIKCQKRAKALDPTRFVEDNSPCNRDHIVTDVNTWHFYSNGYNRVKNVIETFCNNAYIGTKANYKEGFTMADVPCMNSECGNVWGIKGNAGESDISWQYRYMINEFRRHDKLGGFVFTEFHDVVNEFNGYYKIDNSEKDFGYSAYGTGLSDIHSQDYLGADYPPMSTVKAGETVDIPMFASSFTDKRHGKNLNLSWKLTLRNPIDGDKVAQNGGFEILWKGYGCFDVDTVHLTMPEHDGVAEFSWTLYDEGGKVMSNCLLFDIDGERKNVLTVKPKDLQSDGFIRVIPAIQEAKVSGLGSGKFTADIQTADIPNFDAAHKLTVLFEASTREPMTHDFPEEMKPEKNDIGYMLGYRCDPGANRNSFKQTDAVLYAGNVTVTVDGEKVAEAFMPDCPADSRGALSHHYQPVDDLLDEAGTYGELYRVEFPTAKIAGKGKFTLGFETADNAGLSLFGRRSGRYGIDIVLLAE